MAKQENVKRFVNSELAMHRKDNGMWVRYCDYAEQGIRMDHIKAEAMQLAEKADEEVEELKAELAEVKEAWCKENREKNASYTKLLALATEIRRELDPEGNHESRPDLAGTKIELERANDAREEAELERSKAEDQEHKTIEAMGHVRKQVFDEVREVSRRRKVTEKFWRELPPGVLLTQAHMALETTVHTILGTLEESESDL